MMDYRRGDIVLVNFNPQKRAQEVTKVRPAVIVSDTELNHILDLVTVVALTSNLIENAEPLCIRIGKRDKLQKQSDAMIEQLRSVAKSRIVEKVGCANDEEMQKIAYGIKAMLALR